MPYREILLALAVAHVASTKPSLAAPGVETAALCDQAAQRAARAEGVPLQVLRAVARVETGRTVDGALHPWPWTVNREGQGYWFASANEAKSYVFNIFKSGVRSFDVGCFQINYHWHGQAFRSIDAMFDPDENATYAAQFLSELYAELGSWPAAAGAYHSRTEHLAASYSNRFQAVLAQLDDGPTAIDPFTTSASPLFPRSSEPFPRAALGSLVPQSASATAFIPFN